MTTSRTGAARERILEELNNGPRLNYQLNDIAFRYSARIHELRKAGHDIRKRNVGDGLWEYWLASSPIQTQAAA